jgi:RimJ/RimL family protein N-acetyltransferase
MERLGSYADVRNARPQAALERIGFRREGVLRAFQGLLTFPWVV